MIYKLMQIAIVKKATESGLFDRDNSGYCLEEFYSFNLIPKSRSTFCYYQSDFEDELIGTFEFTKKRKK